MGRDVVGVEEFEYSDNTKKENAYGAGGMPIGYIEGNIKNCVLAGDMEALEQDAGIFTNLVALVLAR